jgi:hypothetical protein
VSFVENEGKCSKNVSPSTIQNEGRHCTLSVGQVQHFEYLWRSNGIYRPSTFTRLYCCGCLPEYICHCFGIMEASISSEDRLLLWYRCMFQCFISCPINCLLLHAKMSRITGKILHCTHLHVYATGKNLSFSWQWMS